VIEVPTRLGLATSVPLHCQIKGGLKRAEYIWFFF
jgi:hypothetical protein